jgi:Polysaccharide pyruvyl transferase
MERIAVIGRCPELGALEGRSRLELFQATGGNTGNLAFAAAAHDLVVGSKAYYDWDFDPDAINARHERALLVCANMINPEVDLSELSWRIERLRIPFCAFSLGVQAPLRHRVGPLPPGSERFLRAMSDRAVSVGLRGSVSAEFLSGIGIRNWRVVGCPSNFLNAGLRGHHWAEVAASRDRAVALHVEDVADRGAYIAKFRELVGGSPRRFLFQTPAGLTKAYCNGPHGAAAPGGLEAEEVEFMRVYGSADRKDALRIMGNEFRCFFSIPDWIRSCSDLRFSIGPRLHGNIVALQCGIPSLVVIHDERTREMAECLDMPGVTLDGFHRLHSLEEAMGAALAGVEGYATRRGQLAREFAALLEENGLTASAGLRAVCRAAISEKL